MRTPLTAILLALAAFSGPTPAPADDADPFDTAEAPFDTAATPPPERTANPLASATAEPAATDEADPKAKNTRGEAPAVHDEPREAAAGRAEPEPPRPVDAEETDHVKMRVEMREGENTVVTLPSNPVRILTRTSRVAEVVEQAGDMLLLQAGASGIGTIRATLADGRMAEIEVEVRTDTRELDNILAKLYPAADVTTTVVRDAVLLRGTAERPEHVQQIVEIAEQFYPRVLNQLTVAPGKPVDGASATADLHGTANPYGVATPYGVGGVPRFPMRVFPNLSHEDIARVMNASIESEDWDRAVELAKVLVPARDVHQVLRFIEWKREQAEAQRAAMQDEAAANPGGVDLVPKAIADSVDEAPAEFEDLYRRFERHLGAGRVDEAAADLERAAEKFPSKKMPDLRDVAGSQRMQVEPSVESMRAKLQAARVKAAFDAAHMRRRNEEAARASTQDDPDASPVDSAAATLSVVDELRSLRREVESLRADVRRVLEALEARNESGAPTAAADEADDVSSSAGGESAESLVRYELAMGLEAADPSVMPKDGRYRGALRVTGTVLGGRAASAGLKQGDLLVGLGTWETKSLENVAFVLRRLRQQGERRVKFHVVRKRGDDWETLYGHLPLAESGPGQAAVNPAADSIPPNVVVEEAPGHVRLEVGERRLIPLARPADNVDLGDIAALDDHHEKWLVVRGIRPGRTTLKLNRQGNDPTETFQITVVTAPFPNDSLDPNVPGISIDANPIASPRAE